MVDIPNRIAKNGMIYFPDFCQLVLEQIREEGNGEEDFRMNMFKVTSNEEMFPRVSLSVASGELFLWCENLWK